MNKERAAIVMIVIAGLIFLIGEAVRGEENPNKTLSPYFLIPSEESGEDNLGHNRQYPAHSDIHPSIHFMRIFSATD